MESKDSEIIRNEDANMCRQQHTRSGWLCGLSFDEKNNAMKMTAYIMMSVGFLWIAAACLDLFGSPHHTLWIWHSKNLPAGEMIPRENAVSSMRDMALSIQDTYQPLIIPASMILLGGILNGRKRRKDIETANKTPKVIK